MSKVLITEDQLNLIVEDQLNEQIAYHGTNKKFNTFSLDYIGQGEGIAVHGYGIYLTSNPDVAKHYADRLSLNKEQYVYTVDIKRTNFIPWEGTIDSQFAEEILAELIEKDGINIDDLKDSLGLSEGYYGDYSLFSNFYDFIQYDLGGVENVSKFFNELGYDGIIFESKEAGFQVNNYVVFNADNIRIIEVNKIFVK